MCRSCADGGRRCPGQASPQASAAHNARRRASRVIRRLASQGIDARGERDFPRQFWFDGGSGQAFAAAKFQRLRDPVSPPWKPDGGVWTSPASTRLDHMADLHTTWTDYCDIEGMARRGHLTEITPGPGLVVVHLSSARDVAAAVSRWPLTISTPWGESLTGFSFEEMRADGVDAVYVHDGQVLSHGSLLNGWDVESVAWLNPVKARPGARTSVTWNRAPC